MREKPTICSQVCITAINQLWILVWDLDGDRRLCQGTTGTPRKTTKASAGNGPHSRALGDAGLPT